MNEVEGRYYVSFGKGDSSESIPYDIFLTDEEEKIYDKAVEEGLDLNNIEELQPALQRAYEEIEKQEIEMAIENEDEFVMECQGIAPVDPDEINDLIADRDPHALKFFGLEEASDEELEEWDAYDLEELPLIKDFDENFEPSSPYDIGWDLNVSFVDPNY